MTLLRRHISAILFFLKGELPGASGVAADCRRPLLMSAVIGIAALMSATLSGCGDTEESNGGVLSIEEMASLMADIHMAEAAVDLNRNEFSSDSARLILRQSIYAAHSITDEQADSSYKWYGYHVEEYMKVYDRTLAILDERKGELLAGSGQRAIAEGDSVDIWPYSPALEFSRRSPSRLVTFSVPVDSTWRNGDVVTLRFNMASASSPVVARMVVEYADGTGAFNLQAGKSRGKGTVSVRVDSMLSPVRVAGYLIASPKDGETVRLDSISLSRMRSHLSRGYFAQRPFNAGITRSRKVPADTAGASPAATANTSSASTASTPTANTPSAASAPANTAGTTSRSGNQAVDNSPRRESTAQEALRRQREARNRK